MLGLGSESSNKTALLYNMADEEFLRKIPKIKFFDCLYLACYPRATADSPT